MMLRPIIGTIAAVAIVCAPIRARAQSPSPGRVEVAIGAQWTAATDYGAKDVTETRPDGSSLVLFSSTTKVTATTGVEARVGVRIARRLEVEAAGSYATPQLQVNAFNDYEKGADTTATESRQLYSISGGVLWPLRSESRTIPFVAAGAGWMRQLQGGGTLATAGPQTYVGGGIKRLLTVRDRHRLKGIGVRGDARVTVRARALAVDDRAHASVALTASFFVRF